MDRGGQACGLAAFVEYACLRRARRTGGLLPRLDVGVCLDISDHAVAVFNARYWLAGVEAWLGRFFQAGIVYQVVCLFLAIGFHLVGGNLFGLLKRIGFHCLPASRLLWFTRLFLGLAYHFVELFLLVFVKQNPVCNNR